MLEGVLSKNICFIYIYIYIYIYSWGQHLVYSISNLTFFDDSFYGQDALSNFDPRMHHINTKWVYRQRVGL